jgi:hypothetical protein
MIVLPRRPRGRPSADTNKQYRDDLKRFCSELQKIESGVDFKVSARGWCYILEEHGLAKGDFDVAEKLINDCRKRGDLPLDFCSEDEGRAGDNVERISSQNSEEFAEEWFDYLCNHAHKQHVPISFWDDLGVYVEMTVEKIDLKSLFQPDCKEFHVVITNKQCILLHCGDHDPGGLRISDFLRSNLEDLADAVRWHPTNLEIDRFGLNKKFIDRHRLTWIDNLETGSGGRLDDPEHPDHEKEYVKSYINKFGVRKVEANALVV